MTDSFWNNLGGILTALGLLITAVFAVWTHAKVGKVQEQTNSMNHQMVESAKKEGKAEQKAETATQALPIIVQAAPVASGATQEEITKWMAQGYALGKAVREANGIKDKPPEHS